MKKILALVLALLMIFPLVISCNKKEEGGESTTAATTASTVTYDKWGREMIYSPLPSDVSYNEEEIVFLVREGDILKGQFETSETTPTNLSEALVNRNLAVEQRLNVKLKFEYTEAGTGNSAYNAKIIASAMGGTAEYDIASTFAYYTSGMTYQGYYYDLTKINTMYLDQPYWNQSYVEEAKFADQLYMVIGDANLLSIQNTFCMFYNKDEFAKYFPDVNLYDIVKSGNWTADYFYALSKDIYVDTRANNQADEDDYYGLVTSTHSFNIDAFFAAYGLKICTKNSEGIPELTLNSEKTINAYDDVYEYLYESKGVYLFNANEYENARTSFKESRAVFAVDMLRCGQDFTKNMTANFGVLPLYKASTDQESYTSTPQDSYDAFAILANVGEDRAQMLGAVLEIMSYESYLNVRPEYFEVVTKLMYSNDAEDSKMYDIIIDSIYFDFGMINSYAISQPNLGHLWRTLLAGGVETFSSVYALNATNYENGLEAYLDYFTEMQGLE